MTRPLIVLSPVLAPLTNEKRWMGWKWVETKDGRTKPPFQGRWPSRFANSKDPKTWCDLTICMQAYVENKVDGIGFALLDSNIAAIDIDDCRDPQTGKLHPWAANVVARSGSYAEVTPSNEGIRVLGLATGGKLHRKFDVADGVSCELYRGAERYITITGQQVGTATELANIDELLDTLLEELESAKKAASTKRTNGAGANVGGGKHDLDNLIKDGCGEDFGGDRSRATWYVIHQLIKQGKGDDEIVAVLLDSANGISAHTLDQSRSEEYARKQVEKARQSGTDTDAEIARLAKLSAVQYEHERKAAAERINVRASILDRLVQAERDKLGFNEDDGKQGHAISFPELEPWPEPVAGPELLDGMVKAIRRHVVLPEHACDASALWVVHTYLLDRFLVSPRLGVRSPTKGCGKTLLLDVLGRLVLRPLPAANVSSSAIFRVIEGHCPTLLVDEADTFLYDNDELRGVLNSGHRKGGAVLRTVGDDFEPRAFATFSACVIALIGSLPDTLHDRAVVIDLKRRLPSETIEPFRPDRAGYLDVLARKAVRWAQDHADDIAAADPDMPPGIINRRADNWRPLLAIADVAAGDWPDRARKAAVQSHIEAEDDDASRLELLLGDIRDVFSDKGLDEIASADLVKSLVAIEGRPWAELGKSRKPLTQNRLARLLKPLPVIPENIRAGDKIPKGYVLKRFEEAFARYLPLEGASEPLHRYKADETGTSEPFQTATDQPDVAVRKCEKSANDGLCSVVADGKGAAGEKTHVRAARLKSDDLPYHGPVVEVPEPAPDLLDEHGAPRPVPQPTNGGIEPGLSQRTIRDLAGEYQERTCTQYQESGSTDVDHRPLDAWLRARLAEEVFPEFIEIEFERVMAEVFRV